MREVRGVDPQVATGGIALDWGIGNYEERARELEPAAAHVIGLARLHRGERLLDIACGTGNAAVVAARAGAEVVGLDAAPRLIAVAHERAAAERLEASFVVGDAQALPFEDQSFDVVVSAFGIIFARDAERAFAEMFRVLRVRGRALVSAWIPGGPIHEMLGVMTRAVGEATGRERRPFPWYDPDAITELAGRHGAVARFHEGRLVIVGVSPEDYFALGEANHPMSVAAKPLLERAGDYAAVRARAVEVLRAGNRDPDRFCVTSPYRVIELVRSGR